ncbi:MAG: exosortase-associated EpsI family protein [Schlesneria sp.]
MNQLTSRIWLAAFLMSCGLVSTYWIRSGYTFEVQPLKQSLEALPMELIGYTGSEQPVDPAVSAVLHADTTVNRSYTRPDGTMILLHASGWLRPETIADVAPHNPKVCYTNSGWKILEERNIELTSSIGKLPMCVMLLERDTERCVIGFWYQMGQSMFTTTKDARQVHRQLWGNKKWPATIKFLFQTPAQVSQGIDALLPRIEEFALIVHQWSLEL